MSEQDSDTPESRPADDATATAAPELAGESESAEEPESASAEEPEPEQEPEEDPFAGMDMAPVVTKTRRHNAVSARRTRSHSFASELTSTSGGRCLCGMRERCRSHRDLL